MTPWSKHLGLGIDYGSAAFIRPASVVCIRYTGQNIGCVYRVYVYVCSAAKEPTQRSRGLPLYMLAQRVQFI